MIRILFPLLLLPVCVQAWEKLASDSADEAIRNWSKVYAYKGGIVLHDMPTLRYQSGYRESFATYDPGTPVVSLEDLPHRTLPIRTSGLFTMGDRYYLVSTPVPALDSALFPGTRVSLVNAENLGDLRKIADLDSSLPGNAERFLYSDGSFLSQWFPLSGGVEMTAYDSAGRKTWQSLVDFKKPADGASGGDSLALYVLAAKETEAGGYFLAGTFAKPGNYLEPSTGKTAGLTRLDPDGKSEFVRYFDLAPNSPNLLDDFEALRFTPRNEIIAMGYGITSGDKQHISLNKYSPTGDSLAFKAFAKFNPMDVRSVPFGSGFILAFNAHRSYLVFMYFNDGLDLLKEDTLEVGGPSPYILDYSFAILGSDLYVLTTCGISSYSRIYDFWKHPLPVLPATAIRIPTSRQKTGIMAPLGEHTLLGRRTSAQSR